MFSSTFFTRFSNVRIGIQNVTLYTALLFFVNKTLLKCSLWLENETKVELTVESNTSEFNVECLSPTLGYKMDT